jgi:hypothetical protein
MIKDNRITAISTIYNNYADYTATKARLKYQLVKIISKKLNK